MEFDTNKINSNIFDSYRATLSTKDFNRLSEFIMYQYGIKLPPVKLIMLQSRLQKRLRALNMSNFKDYVDYVLTPNGLKEEVIHMMDEVSTNKTDFFREPVHFDFLLSHVLPEYYNNFQSRPMKVWSAGCSSGEEPYTLGMVLSEFTVNHPCFDFVISATDISTKMLDIAVEAIYKEARIEFIPLSLKRKYFLKNKNPEEKTVRIIPELRRSVSFSRLNLIDERYHISHYYDVIFCRNVLIYFDRITQGKILQKLCMCLNTNGYLFLGHSETITGLDLPLKQIRPTIFRRL